MSAQKPDGREVNAMNPSIVCSRTWLVIQPTACPHGYTWACPRATERTEREIELSAQLDAARQKLTRPCGWPDCEPAKEATANLLALQVELKRVREALEHAHEDLHGSKMHADLCILRGREGGGMCRLGHALSSPLPAAEVGKAVSELIVQATLAHRGECPTAREDGMCGGCHLNDVLTRLRTLGLGPKEK